MTISHFYGNLRQFHIATDTSGQVWTSCSGQEWQFHIATDMLVVKNGIFTFLLTSSGLEWQFHIATDM